MPTSGYSAFKARTIQSFDLHSDLQDILWRNGMTGRIGYDNRGQLSLFLRTVNSPWESFSITQEQADDMRRGGYDSLDRKAYSTLYSIARQRFQMPAFATAHAYNPLVNMGGNGYRPGFDERPWHRGWGGPRPFWPRHGIFGWFGGCFGRPAYYDGYGFRRTPNGELMYGAVGGPMIAQRYDGYVGPGEITSFSQGCYWKGPQGYQQGQQAAGNSGNLDIGNVQIEKLKPWYEGKDTAGIKTYSELIPEKKYFTKDKWSQVLSSHGVTIVAKDAKTGKPAIYLDNMAFKAPVSIPLSEEQYNTIMAPHLPGHIVKTRKGKKKDTGVSIDARIKALNEAMRAKGIEEDLTKQMLDKKEFLNLKANPSATAKANQAFILQDNAALLGPLLAATSGDALMNSEVQKAKSYLDTHLEFAQMSKDEKKAYMTAHPDDFKGQDQKLLLGETPDSMKSYVDKVNNQDGRARYKTGFIDHENSIPVVDGRMLDQDKGFYIPMNHGKAMSVGEIIAYPDQKGFHMSAVINGEIYTHDIDEKTYLKFLNRTDQERLEIFDKTFNEVEIKGRHAGGGEQYNDYSGNIEDCKDAATLKGKYSLLHDDTAYIITGATAYLDKTSGEYILSVRESGDVGMWRFHMTEEQFNAFKNGDDAKKAEIIGQVGNFHDKQGNAYKIISDAELLRSPFASYVKVGEQGIADKQFVQDILKNDHSGLYHELIEKQGMSQEGIDRLRAIANNRVRTELSGKKGETIVSGESRQDQMSNKMWVRSGEGAGGKGREASVGDISIWQVKDKEGNPIDGKYKMSAVIDGNTITHDITKKDVEKFASKDDYGKLKLFDKIFDEVKMKRQPGTGVNWGAAVCAALTVVGMGALAVGAMRHRPGMPPPRGMGHGYYYNNAVAGSDYVTMGHVMHDIDMQNAAANYFNHFNAPDDDPSRGLGRGV